MIEASMKNNVSRREFARVLLGLTAGLLAGPTAFADEQAGVYVQKLGKEVIKLANGGKRGDKALQRRFAELFNRYINIPNVASFALGTYQKQLPAADKSKFYDLVANYAAALFVWYVDDFQGEGLEITNSVEQGKFTIIDSGIKGSGLGSEKLRWRVSGSGGNYKIADLNVKGVWLTISMKKLFADTLKASHGDFEALYAKLREAETW
jgi:phospholipid transport system substrate-binding protein